MCHDNTGSMVQQEKWYPGLSSSSGLSFSSFLYSLNTKRGGQREELGIKISYLLKWNQWDTEMLQWKKSCLLLLQVTASALTMSCWWKTLLPSSLISMEFTGSSQKQETSQANGPFVCKRSKVTFLWVKLAGKVLQSCMCVILTVGEVTSLEVLCRTLKVFICDLARSLAKELINWWTG